MKQKKIKMINQTLYVNINSFQSINCLPNFTVITIPEKNKKVILKTRDILLKYKTDEATIGLKQFFLSFNTTLLGGLRRP